MDNFGEKHGSDRKQLKGLWARLLIVGDLINRLASLFRLTQQDLIDAGVFHRKMRD